MPDTGSYKAWMHRYRKYLISVGAIAVLIALIIALMPFGIQYAMVAWLEGDNDRSANIENVDFNPFTGELLVEGLKVEEPNGRRLELPRVFLDVELSALFKKRVYLHAIGLTGGSLEIQQGIAGELRITGLPQPATPKEPAEASDWQFGAGSVEVARLQVRLHLRGGQDTIVLQKLQIENIAPWQSDVPSRIDTALTLGDATVRASGNFLAFNEKPSVDAKLTVKFLDLARVRKLTASTVLRELTGVISAQLDIQGNIQENRKMSLGLTGSVGLDKVSVLVAETDKARAGSPATTRPTGDPPASTASDLASNPTTTYADKKEQVDGPPRLETHISLARMRIADMNAKLLLNRGLPETVELAADTQIEGLEVDTGNFKLSEKSLQWKGKLTGSRGASGTTSLQATGNFKSAAGELRFGSGTNQAVSAFSFDRIAINDLAGDVKQSAAGDIDAQMTAEVSLHKVEGVADGTVLNNEEIGWKGKLTGSRGASGTTSLQATGNFKSAAGELRLGSGTNQAVSAFSFDRIAINDLAGDVKQSAAGDIDAQMTAEVSLHKVEGVADGRVLNNEEIGWKGALGATVAASGEIRTRVEGEFNSRLLKLVLPKAGLQVTQESARWRGRFDSRQQDALAKPGLSLKGIAETGEIRVESPDLGLRLLSLGALTIDDVTVRGIEDIHVRQVSVRALETVRQLPSDSSKTNETEPYAVVRGALTANDLTVIDGSQVRIKEVFLEGASGQIERLENGELRVVGSLLRLIGELGARDKGQDRRESKPVRVQIDDWTVKGNSRLLLVDRAVKPPTKLAIMPIEIRLKNIDSAMSEGKVPIEIAATLGKYSKLNLQGSIKPFSKRLNLDVVGKVDGLDLTALSSYSSEYMGYDLTRGRMDTEIHISIIEGGLKAESKLVISGLSMEPTDPALLDPLKIRLQLPLETALSLLKDSDDVIRLSVPVSGNVTNPKFDFSDAVNTAIGNAMKKTILRTVLLPLGGVMMVMEGSKLQLNPVSFKTGLDVLNPPAKEYLMKIADLLRARPTVKISICGWATPKDREFLIDRDFVKAKTSARKAKSAEKQTAQAAKDPKAASADAILRDKIARTVQARLPDLGKRRGEAVKDHLIERFTVSETRLFLCTPKVSKEADALPRVELFL